MEKYPLVIKKIVFSDVDTSDKVGLRDFFARVRNLPHLESFTSQTLGGVSTPRVWREIASLPGLKEVSLPLEDDAIELLASHNPHVKKVSSPGLSKLGSRGLDLLSSLKDLEELGLIATDKTLIGILSQAKNGFSSLKKLTLHWYEIGRELINNFPNFKNLKSLEFYLAEEKSLLSFLKDAALLSPKRLDELSIHAGPYFKFGSPEYSELLDILPSLELKVLKLSNDIVLDVDQYKKLEANKSLEVLDIPIPQSKNLESIKNLVRNLVHLKALTLRFIPGKSYNKETIQAQSLNKAEKEELLREFPKLKISYPETN